MAFNITKGQPNAVCFLTKENNSSYEVFIPKETNKQTNEIPVSDQASFPNCQCYRTYGR